MLRSLRFTPVLLMLAACATTGPSPFDEQGPTATAVQVRVENRGFNDLRLYALSNHGQVPMGTVNGNSSRTIQVPWRQLDQISFRIDVLAGRSYRTEALAVSAGDKIELVIPDNPANAYLRAR